MSIKFLPLKRAVRTALLVLLLNVVGLTKGFAYDFSAVCSTGQTLYYEITDATNHYVALVGSNGDSYYSDWDDFTEPTGDIVFPESVQNGGVTYTVTSIGNWAFSGCNGLTGNLTIPNSVTSIGGSAFSGCSGFNGDLVIPSSITNLGSSAFSGCSFEEVYFNAINVITASNYYGIFHGCSGHLNLSEDFVQIPDYLFYGAGFTGTLMIPNSVTSIGNAAFSGCSGFTGNLIIPNSVTTIGGSAFSGCSGFTGSLVIPNSVTTIGGSAFSGCSGFTGSLVIPNSVTTIGDYAFSNCSEFTGDLVIPNSVTTIGYGTFQNCTGLDGELVVPANVTSIGSYAFWGCSGLSGELVLPDNLTTIEEGVFYGCSGFSGELNLPTSITTIGYCAFYGCSGFSGELSFPASITTIGSVAFLGCTGFTGSLVILDSITSLGANAFQDCTGITEVHYNATNCSIPDYGYGPFQGCNGTLTIADNVERIPDFMFRYANFTGELIIPNSVTEIGVSAFEGCGFTGDLIIPNSVTSIGYWAFSWCTGFDGELVIPESITRIEGGVFSNCSGFTGNLNIPNSVTYIGYGAFGWCQGFDGSLNLSNSLETIGEQAFTQCTGFTGDLIIPNTVTSIGYSTFAGCTGFDGTLTLSNSLTSIEQYVFSDCSGFTGDLVIPNSVTNIGAVSFKNCSGFDGTLILGDSLLTIGNGAFSGCSGFTGDLVIPNTVTAIGVGYASHSYDGVFYNCTGFNGRLVLGSALETIGDYAFIGCGFTGDLVIPSSVTTIGYYAFGLGNNNTITSIMLYPVNPPSMYGSFAMNNIHIDDPANSIKMYVPYESLEDYKTAEYWSEYQPIIYPWLQKSVSGYGSSEGDWYFLASPLVENANPTTVENLITETEYDLYQFNQSFPMQEWQNYEANMEAFVLENGLGYLYANKEDVDLIFKGEFNEDETKLIELTYDANAALAGWNLVGNPFPVDAYVNKSYYTMNEDGTALEPIAASMETIIPTCTGIMVKADNINETVVFSKMAPEMVDNQGVLQVVVVENNVRGDAVQDKAYVSFNANDRLEKYIFNKDGVSISVFQGGKDFAIAFASEQDEIPLNFKAAKNGQYTISVNVDGMDFSYLHLIDNLTGADVDLLAEPSYTFEAKTSDYASRFLLQFIPKDGSSTSSETFAFISNGNIIITGMDTNSTLQIVDVTGRIIISRKGDAMNRVSTSGVVPGVYVLRLINGDNVKTQKIVVK